MKAMSTMDSVRPKPLTKSEQRLLDRLQIKWSKQTITAEEKTHALALSNRAWLAAKAECDRIEVDAYEQHIADTNAKTNAAMTPKERAASARVAAAVATPKDAP